jgi:hypothetical protein
MVHFPKLWHLDKQYQADWMYMIIMQTRRLIVMGQINNTSGEYTIPTGYSGWWEITLKLYHIGYGETTSVVSIQKNNALIINSGDYPGQRGDLTTFLKVNEGDVLRVYQQQASGQYSFFADRSWWQMKWITDTI